jgi:stage II sporulation SpoAA-like protein
MPLYWTIDSKAELVTVTAEGDVTRADADAYLDAIEGGGAIAYRKLFDGSAGTLGMDQEELMTLGVRIRSYHHLPVGALAIVMSDDKREAVGRFLGILASADRPMRLFASATTARRWLESLASA